MFKTTTILYCLAIALGVYYGIFWLAREIKFTRSIFKTLPVAVLALTAFLADMPMMLIIALFLSAFGDAFLAHDSEKSFLAGLGSFLLAHIAFSALFLTQSGSGTSDAIMSAIATLTLILILVILKNLWPYLGAMKIAVVLYTLAIAAMNLSAWHGTQNPILLTGVMLFVLSDIILAHEIFYWKSHRTKIRASYFVWVTYFAAQAMILLAYFNS